MNQTSTPFQVFIAFSRASLLGFGGMLPQVYRMLVEKLEWMDAQEFAHLWTVALLLPGPAICNLAAMVGHRRAGVAGSYCALLGVVLLPSVFVIVLGVLYQRFEHLDRVRQALHGMSAATVGMLIAMGLKLKGPANRRWLPWLPIGAIFVSIGILRLPFLLVIALAIPILVGIAWRRAAR